jgi:hypothetical protein
MRILDSVQLTAKHQVANQGNRKPGGADDNALKSFLTAGISTSQVSQALAEPYAPAKKSVATVLF